MALLSTTPQTRASLAGARKREPVPSSPAVAQENVYPTLLQAATSAFALASAVSSGVPAASGRVAPQQQRLILSTEEVKLPAGQDHGELTISVPRFSSPAAAPKKTKKKMRAPPGLEGTLAKPPGLHFAPPPGLTRQPVDCQPAKVLETSAGPEGSSVFARLPPPPPFVPSVKAPPGLEAANGKKNEQPKEAQAFVSMRTQAKHTDGIEDVVDAKVGSCDVDWIERVFPKAEAKPLPTLLASTPLPSLLSSTPLFRKPLEKKGRKPVGMSAEVDPFVPRPPGQFAVVTPSR